MVKTLLCIIIAALVGASFASSLSFAWVEAHFIPTYAAVAIVATTMYAFGLIGYAVREEF